MGGSRLSTDEHIHDHSGGEQEEATALAGVACDLRLHEVNWVVGCVVPASTFEGGT